MSEIIIARAVMTCSGCPSQWDSWDIDGNYWYLRYRSSRGEVVRQPGPDWETWPAYEPNITFKGGEDDADGFMDLGRFAELAGITLHPACQVTEGELFGYRKEGDPR